MQNVKLNICDGFSSLYYGSSGPEGRKHERGWEGAQRTSGVWPPVCWTSQFSASQCRIMLLTLVWHLTLVWLICLANNTGCRSMLMPLTMSMTQASLPTWALWCLMSIWAFLELVTRLAKCKGLCRVGSNTLSVLSVNLHGQYTGYIIIFGEDSWVICQCLLIAGVCKAGSLPVWFLTVNREHPGLHRGFMSCI